MLDGADHHGLPDDILADVLSLCRPDIIDVYLDRLTAQESPLMLRVDPAQARESADALLGYVIDRLRHPDSGTRAGSAMGAMVGALRATQNIRPEVSLRAAATLFNATMSTMVSRLPDTMESATLVRLAGTLHESLVERLASAAVGYTTYLMEVHHRAHLYERRRVARELHDEVAHTVLAALNNLELHQLYAEAEPDRAKAKLGAAEHGLRDALDTLRGFTRDLRRSPVDGGLVAALRRYLSGASWSGVWMVRLEGNESLLPPTVQGELFLVLREALRNVQSHSAASSVEVTVVVHQDSVTAVVVDDGRGFDVETATVQGSGIGLISMQERVAMLGGCLSTDSTPGRGTRITVDVPLCHVIRGDYD